MDPECGLAAARLWCQCDRCLATASGGPSAAHRFTDPPTHRHRRSLVEQHLSAAEIPRRSTCTQTPSQRFDIHDAAISPQMPRTTSDPDMSSKEGPGMIYKGHYSCDFCRSRKLRCDRPTPCTNCVSRGKDCVFGPAAPRRPRRTGRTARLVETSSRSPPALSDAAEEPSAATAERSQHAASTSTPSTKQDLLADIQALKRLAHDLETRVNASSSQGQSDDRVAILSPSCSHPSPVPSWAGTGTPSSRLGQVVDVVAHLQRVSRSESSQVRYTRPSNAAAG